MRLLIAEDDVFFQRILLQVLGSNYEIVVAQDGNEAWGAIQAPGAPRLAILDWVMPGLSGPQVCRKVRACAALSSMYLIILTARNNEADIVSGLRAGADDYITKPPMPAELQARVRVGERVLKLQEAVKAQSGMADQFPAREGILRQSVVGCPTSQMLLVQEPSSEMEASRPQLFHPGEDCAITDTETSGLIRRATHYPLEDRHSHR